MPVPLPTDNTVDLSYPSPEESRSTARGIASAVEPEGGLTDIQRVLLEALMPAMTGTQVDLERFEPMSAHDLAVHLGRRRLEFRQRCVQMMLLCALVLCPLPRSVADRIRTYAAEMNVDDDMIDVARRFAEGALGLAAQDFERNGYAQTWTDADAEALHTSKALGAQWDVAVHDPRLSLRWAALENLPPGSLGRGVWELYRARGFEFPGNPGSAPPLLAQHDWVHVLADYGTTVEAELEVFGLIARATDEMRGFSLLAMVVSLFETGYLRSGAGLFQYDVGHLSAGRGMATRLADAMRRGALCSDSERVDDHVDFLRVDWFSLAPMQIDAARARFHLVGKSDAAIAAGSVGPCERGGISPFQIDRGRVLADDHGYRYDAFGASVG